MQFREICFAVSLVSFMQVTWVCDLAHEGKEIILETRIWSPEPAAACEVQEEIKFEFPGVDAL